MNGQKQNKQRRGLRHIAVALASSAVLTAGCANMESTAVSSPVANAESSTMTGQVHGGNQPVSNAVVQLYTVGQAGNGSAGALLATTATNAQGGFGFTKGTDGTTYPSSGNTYSCPTQVNGKTIADPLVYVKVSGGNTTGTGTTNNTAAVFLAPLGFCSQINGSTFVNISEVTTVATVAALAQYINPATENIGGDGIGVVYAALANQFRTIGNLVNQSTGLANSNIAIAPTANGVNNSTVTMTATPETAKINTIANILSACVNQMTATSTNNCSTLFANATPPPNAARTSMPTGTFPTASDTLQAALYMFLYPTDGSTTARTNLYNLAPANGAPYQPTLTSVPTDWTVAISYSTSSPCANSSSPFFSNPYDMSIDISGNVWLSNNAPNGSLVEISNSGAALTCVALNTKGLTGGIIDRNGNIWYGDAINNKLYRYTPSNGGILTYTTAGPVLGLTVDGTGATIFTTTTGGTGSVYRIAGGASDNFANAPVIISNTVGPNPARIFPDNAGDFWVTSGAGFVTEVSAATGGANFLSGYTSTQYSVVGPTYGVVVGPSNRIFVTSADPAATLTILTPSGSSFAVTATSSANSGGLSNPQGIWIDGVQNSWVANNTAQSGNNAYSLAELAVDGTAIAASGNVAGGYQKSNIFLNKPRQTVIDPGGNVWVTNDGNATSLTEVIGAAVPIYEPYSSGLVNGSFMGPV